MNMDLKKFVFYLTIILYLNKILYNFCIFFLILSRTLYIVKRVLS